MPRRSSVMDFKSALRDVKVWQNDSSLVNLAETKGAGNVPSPESDLTRKPRSPM